MTSSQVNPAAPPFVLPDDPNTLRDLREAYKRQGYALLRYDDGPIHSYPYDSPWLTDPHFNALYETIRHNTLVDRARCYALYLLTDQVREVAGNILEVGTWRGGTAGLLASCLPERTVYIGDTFEGVVKSSAWEHYQDRTHSDTDVGLVRDLLSRRLDLNNFKILKGVFPEETGQAVNGEQFALVHLDVDVYRSTKDAFNFAWPRVPLHGIVVFDDYGMTSACNGISTFVNEIRDDSDKLFISNLNGQACIIKK